MNRLLFFAAALCVAAPIHGQDAAPRSAVVYELSEVDSMPRPTNVVALRSVLEAAYPPALQRAGRGGRVLLSAVVAADGSMDQMRVVESTDSAFNAPSLSSIAVLRWTPGSLGGRPVATRVQIPVEWEAPPPADDLAAQVEYELKDVAVQPRLRNEDELRNALVRAYPSSVKETGNALVMVRMRVDTQGVPSRLQIVSSSDIRFNQASLEAAAVARFHPASIGGQGVPVWVTLPVAWQIQ